MFHLFIIIRAVKIVTDKQTRQSLGFAYVWFTRKMSVQVAVKEMDGKVEIPILELMLFNSNLRVSIVVLILYRK